MVNSMYWILGIVWYLLVVIGAWKMFEKAGEAGWKAIIPIYNMYIVFKFAWQTMYFGFGLVWRSWGLGSHTLRLAILSGLCITLRGSSISCSF